MTWDTVWELGKWPIVILGLTFTFLALHSFFSGNTQKKYQALKENVAISKKGLVLGGLIIVFALAAILSTVWLLRVDKEDEVVQETSQSQHRVHTISFQAPCETFTKWYRIPTGNRFWWNTTGKTLVEIKDSETGKIQSFEDWPEKWVDVEEVPKAQIRFKCIGRLPLPTTISYLQDPNY